jgi:hypothetical protein
MKRLLALTALILGVSIGNAQAAMITFEDLPLEPSGGGDRISGGFLFDTALNHSHIDNGTWGTSNGSQFMMIDNVAASAVPINNLTTFSPIVGAPFALTSIDISEAAGITTSARQIEVTGNLFGGGTISTLLILDNNFTDVVANYFQTFIFDSSWSNLSSVALNGIGATCCGQPPGNYFAIDNIVVDVAPTAVPEPGTLSLLGLASAYMFGRRRRNRR